MKKILLVFGTRPEAIKMAPLVKHFLEEKQSFETKVCITAQHREMLDQVLDFFEIIPDYDLSLMKPNQNLYGLTSAILLNMQPVLENFKPDYVFVHGDTTTTMATTMAAFYAGAKIAHIEAGLRTNNLYAPFPEEMNRQVTGIIANLHFAPTARAQENLLEENKKASNIFVTGNTVIDALQWSTGKVSQPNYHNPEIEALKSRVDFSKKIILVTGHRRENHAQGIIEICRALASIAEKYGQTAEIVYPVHPNPNIQQPVHQLLDNIANIHLVKPLSYPAFVWLMKQSYFIITDSGGIQEEAPSLGKPVLLMRDTTERPEAVAAGTVKMVGAHCQNIQEEAIKLMENTNYYNSFTKTANPYGDGKATQRIVEVMKGITGFEKDKEG